MNGDPRDQAESPQPSGLPEIRPAKRSSAKPLIGIYAESGKGKTYSSLLLARGFVGTTGKIGMIETESGRGEAFADLPEFAPGYEVAPLREPFSPQRYGGLIAAFEKANIGALIIDSASHEWEGVGGVLDAAATNQANGKSGPLVWQKPKIDHQKHFMLRLMQTSIPLVIVCMRAKYPMEERIGKSGKKEWARSETLYPKQSEDILYEMFVHGWIDDAHKFHGTKYTRPDLANIIRSGEPITLETGRALAAWSRGEAVHVEQTGGGTKPRGLKLVSPDGEEISVPTAGEWAQKLTAYLEASDKATAEKLYDANIDAFHKINGRAKETQPMFADTVMKALGDLLHAKMNQGDKL